MANNQYKNKVVYNGTTLIDLTGDTVTAGDVASGKLFHLATGEQAVGTATEGSVIITDTQDVHGGTIREITAQVVNIQASKSATPSETAQTIEPDEGYDALAEVEVGAISSTYVGSGITQRSSSDLTASGATVSVPSGYYASNASKAISNGSATTPATTITANPTISVNSSTGVITATTSKTQSVTPTVSAGYVSSGTAGTITVSGSNTSNLSTQAGTTITPTESQQTAVAAGKYTLGDVKVGAISSTYVGSGITQRSSTDLTASGATVTVPAGYYASQATKSVSSGTAGTPTATKGAVSNHSISVTPSVTNTAGYISGGTINGTAVSVSASELVSGSQTVTENDTYDVTNLAEVVVNVAGSSASGIKYIYTDIDGQGAWNVSGYEYCSVDYAPVDNGVGRLWIRLTDPTSLTVQLYFYYSSSTTYTIDWGDGNTDTITVKGHSRPSHTYINTGRYVIEVDNGGIFSNYTMTNGSNTDDFLLYGAEVSVNGATKNYSFSGCKNLVKCSFDEGVTSIGIGYLVSCLSLKNVILPQTLTTIGESFVRYNTSLKEITIPENVTSIGSVAFAELDGLVIHMRPTTPPTIQSNTFDDASIFQPSISAIFVPNDSLSAYQSATNWSAYSAKIYGE